MHKRANSDQNTGPSPMVLPFFAPASLLRRKTGAYGLYALHCNSTANLQTRPEDFWMAGSALPRALFGKKTTASVGSAAFDVRVYTQWAGPSFKESTTALARRTEIMKGTM